MSEFKVCVDIEGWKEFYVEAESAEEAWRLVTEEDPYDCDSPVDIGDVEYNDMDSGGVTNMDTDETKHF